MTSVLEAYDTCRYAADLAQRLSEAAGRLSDRPDLQEERSWLEAAGHRVDRASRPFASLHIRVLGLEALASARADRSRYLRSKVLDAIEELHAEVVAAGGEVSPLYEVLFLGVKLPTLRRGSAESFDRFAAELLRRLSSSYVTRVIEDPSYERVKPLARVVEDAVSVWRAGLEEPPPTPEQAEALSAELAALATGLGAPIRQARLLAEAALLSAGDVLDELHLLERPKRKRASKAHGTSEDGQPSPDVSSSRLP